jgi:hypothetical protein
MGRWIWSPRVACLGVGTDGVGQFSSRYNAAVAYLGDYGRGGMYVHYMWDWIEETLQPGS